MPKKQPTAIVDAPNTQPSAPTSESEATYAQRRTAFMASYLPGTTIHVDFAMLVAPDARANPDKAIACTLGDLDNGGAWCTEPSGKKHFVNYVRIVEFWQ